MTDYDLGRPEAGDVVELILDDHRLFETLLRDLRDVTSDRDAALEALAALHVAHALAEESEVYPHLRQQDAIDDHEAEHGVEEHADGHRALLAVMECDEREGEEFDELVEALATAINHHLTEEELTILNPAREEVEADVRERLGRRFAHSRNERLDHDCGDIENVRRLVGEADGDGGSAGA